MRGSGACEISSYHRDGSGGDAGARKTGDHRESLDEITSGANSAWSWLHFTAALPDGANARTPCLIFPPQGAAAEKLAGAAGVSLGEDTQFFGAFPVPAAPGKVCAQCGAAPPEGQEKLKTCSACKKARSDMRGDAERRSLRRSSWRRSLSTEGLQRASTALCAVPIPAAGVVLQRGLPAGSLARWAQGPMQARADGWRGEGVGRVPGHVRECG